MRPGIFTRFCVILYVIMASPIPTAVGTLVCHLPIHKHHLIHTRTLVFRGSLLCKIPRGVSDKCYWLEHPDLSQCWFHWLGYTILPWTYVPEDNPSLVSPLPTGHLDPLKVQRLI
jgi:hypothetical protein